MRITIDPRSPVAPYDQIRTQLADAIHAGSLAPGTRLPTVRGLAAELGLAPNTVARAYRELEQAGAVRTGGRNGTIVEQSGEAADRAAFAAAQDYVRRARELGLDDEASLRWVRTALAAGPGPAS
ncbi:GntR family transcriptional regulator [Pengzhenrongella sicca]|uniref:GntR family transcriptional regulator n=1 Tax=Pengzhenrongella sicca TaxID=2819238 RepID=A0A8A4ZIQ0_9MICO|nr:GntR family transcriptional regulator [Pengzhenrongella sicca]QTE30397.1 GntR family transcriptional regulator [Pengzhenrongella sicca]